jgi:tetratricopeptide (TPR) repeat protein
MFPRGLLLACLAAGSLFAAALPSTVKAWEDKAVIPTYLAGDPEPNPLFFFGRSSQGALAPIYPYPMYDSLTGRKVDKTYTVVHLENEYIRIGILPEVGGRIFEGVDKTDNYNFIYRQHVIKPALIGLLGAWISGGVEWNIPHHHRATTFLPVQYKIEANPDGSKTVWIGELEVRQRMRWAVGYTLRPGKAVLEASVRILNRTPVENTMLCFANVAVHANENYQVIFPPSTQYGTGHGKRTFTTWPISDTIRGGPDMTTGIDISWYKNHISSNSVFAWNYQDDFFAGYDHGKNAGTMSVADHNVIPGKKFFTWGNGPTGKRWDRVLTDDDGPYLEMMVGAYSDNQPDYSWLQPYEARAFTMNWYPFRDIGGVKKANLDAAVNLDVAGGVAKVGFYATAAHSAAVVSLKAGGRTLVQETVAIDPGKPWTRQVPVPGGIDEHDLVASISDGGKVLVSYSPVRLKPEPPPKPVTTPPAPANVASNDELYLIGLRADQFHDPNIDPMPYWNEALRRDSGDVRVNTVLGIAAFRKARYEEAAAYMRRALDRATDRYTDPKDGEALYYLGAVLKAEGKPDEAYAQFYKATWSEAWKSASFLGLAEIAAGRGEMTAALDFANRSLDSNALNLRALNLKAAMLRHLGRSQEALQTLDTASRRADPLDVRAMAERWLAAKDPVAARAMASTMNAHPATAQETAAEFLDEGLWQDGAAALLQMTAAAPDKSKINPMAYYYLAYFAARLDQPQKAAEYRKLAQSMPADYVFPFQNEEIDVLRWAIAADPRDARAPYYLGDLLYDWQPEEAARFWQVSETLDPSFAIVHRNLATAYMHQKPAADLAKAIAELEQAVACERKYALHFTELDELYEQAGAPIENRLALFEKNADVVARRDDAQNRAIALKIAAGKLDDAIAMMTGRVFAPVEGANLNVAEHWTDARILRARADVAAGRDREALAEFQEAMHPPTNLPVGLGYAEGAGVSARTAEIAYFTGLAYDHMGDSAKAADSWNQAANGGAGGAQSYYRALAMRKIGRGDAAREVFQSLVDSGQNQLRQPSTAGGGRGGRGAPQTPRARSANAHYLAGLGYLGLDDSAKAKAELTQAVEDDPDLLAARTALAAIR